MGRACTFYLVSYMHLFAFIVATYGVTPHTTIIDSIALQGCSAAINHVSNETTNRFIIMVTNGYNTKLDGRCLEATHTEASRIFRNHVNQSDSTFVRIASSNDSSFQYEYTYHGNVAGNVVGLTIVNIDLSRSSGFVDSLRNLTRVRQLSLVNTNLTMISDGLFENLNELVKLVITGNHLKKLPSQAFRYLSHLQKLDLSNNKIEDLPEETFCELVSLRELHLNDNSIRDNFTKNYFSRNKNLTVVNLGRYRHNYGFTTGITDQIFQENRNLETLNLTENKIDYMHSGIFANLTRLKYLDLSSNSFKHVGQNWFTDLIGLESLIIVGNTVFGENIDLLKNLTKLKYLDARYCAVTNLTSETFANMINLETIMLSGNLKNVPNGAKIFYNNSKLRTIRLKGCNIARFDPSWFLNLALLEFVDFRKNSLKNLSFTDLYQFTTPNSTKNVTFDFSDNDSLQDLYFRSAEKVRHIDYFGIGGRVLIKVNRISNENSCDFGYVRGYMSSTQRDIIIEEITPRKQKSVSSRDIRQCNCEGNESPCSCFYNATRKTVALNCSQTKMHSLTEELVTSWWPFLNIYPDYKIVADLSQNSLKSLPQTNEWEFHSRIVSLNLSNNQLNHQAFLIDWSCTFPHLSTMDLSKNKLSQIPSEFLTFVANSRVKRNLTLFLAENPLRCDCSDLTWLKEFVSIINKSAAVTDFDDLECFREGNPTNLLQTLTKLTDQDHIENTCRTLAANISTSPYVVAYVVIPILIVLVVACVLVVCWSMRNQSNRFTKSHLNKKIQVKSQTPLLKYDAFISYSHKDEDFVVNELVPNLENPRDGSPKCRLCLHERDWLAGEWILDQINQSIAMSHQTIIVLSENFIESFWGKHEFRVAYQQVTQSKQRRLIVIIKDEVPDLAPLDEDLRHFIANNTYLKCSDPLFWRRLREALPSAQVNLCLASDNK